MKFNIVAEHRWNMLADARVDWNASFLKRALCQSQNIAQQVPDLHA
jgi:hypothetical protein